MRPWHKVALAVSLLLSFAVAAIAAPPMPPQGTLPGTGSLAGQVMTSAGEPLAGGMVQFFSSASGPPPSATSYWRVPDFMRRLDQDGRFTMQLPSGTYYLGALKRSSGRAVGPPQEGDLFLVSADEQGAAKAYTVLAGISLDVGRLGDAIPFESSTVNYGKGITAVEGVVLDQEGKPVEKAHVLAFTSANGGRPLYAASPTGKDGKFILRVADGGSYFLKVRSSYGGAPSAAGQMAASFAEKAPAVVTLKKGERQGGITIQVVKFAGRGKQPAAQEQSMQSTSVPTRR